MTLTVSTEYGIANTTSSPTGVPTAMIYDSFEYLRTLSASAGVPVSAHGTIGDGTSDDYAAILAAEAAADTADQQLLFPPGTYLIKTSISFDVPVLFSGGVIKLAAGVTVTFNQPYSNPSRQKCFDEQDRTPDEAGGVRIALKNPQDTVYPQDWGAVADDTTDDNQLPIQQAIDAFDYPLNSDGKVGRVVFTSGLYLCSDSIFVGFDWETYDGDWGAHAAASAVTCWSESAVTPQKRKQFVVLEGQGLAMLKYSGALASTKYLLYDTDNANAKAFTYIKNLALDCQRKCRGAYVAGHKYGRKIDGLYIYRAWHVGLDMDSCWGSIVDNVFTWYCYGIAIRARTCPSMVWSNIIPNSTQGHHAALYPAPDEAVIHGYGAAVTQTKVWDRAVFDCVGGTGKIDTVIFEGERMGTGSWVAVNSGASNTVTLWEHNFVAGDTVRWQQGEDWGGGVSTTVSVAGVATDSFRVEDDCPGSAASYVLYKRCSEITKATPCVVTCTNHGLAEGQWVKIMAPSTSDMVYLSDTWYRCKYIDADSFSFWTTWDDDAATPFEDALDTDTVNYTATVTDGDEYIVASAAAMTLYANNTVITNIRLEGNSILRSKIITKDNSLCLTIDTVSVNESIEGLCDYFIEWRDSTVGCTVRSVSGDGINKAIAIHTCPTSNQDGTPTCPTSNPNWAMANTIENCGVWGLTPLDVAGIVEWGTFPQEGNNIAGSTTPIIAVTRDPSPSVNGTYTSSYRPGRVSVLNGNTAVVESPNFVGTTNFLTDFKVGDKTRISDGSAYFTCTIAAIASDAAMTLTVGYPGTDEVDGYHLYQAAGLGSQRVHVRGAMLTIPASHSVDIVNFDDGQDGQLLTVRFLDGNTTVVHDDTKIYMTGTANVTPAAKAILQFHNVSGVWYQI